MLFRCVISNETPKVRNNTSKVHFVMTYYIYRMIPLMYSEIRVCGNFCLRYLQGEKGSMITFYISYLGNILYIKTMNDFPDSEEVIEKKLLVAMFFSLTICQLANLCIFSQNHFFSVF